LGFSKNPLLDP